jgi:hypothetical protein
MIKNDTTQEERVLIELQRREGGWVNGQYFLRDMYLSQYHRAIWNLQHKRERYHYEGEIEASKFKDEHGFKSYRLKKEEVKLTEDEKYSLLAQAFNNDQLPTAVQRKLL